MSRTGDITARVVEGALRNAIHDHGPITEANMSSAVKRVVGQLRGCASNIYDPSDETTRYRAALDAAHKRYEKLRFGHDQLRDHHQRLQSACELADEMTWVWRRRAEYLAPHAKWEGVDKAIEVSEFNRTMQSAFDNTDTKERQ